MLKYNKNRFQQLIWMVLAMISRKTNISLKLLSVFLAATMLAGCSFTHETEETKHKRTKHTTEETEDIEETEKTKRTETSQATDQTSESSNATKHFVLDRRELNLIMTDAMVFMFEPNEVYRCDANGDGSDDYLLLNQSVFTYMICCSNNDSIVAYMFSQGNCGYWIYYSSGLKKMIIEYGRAGGSFGGDAYAVFNGIELVENAGYEYEYFRENDVYDFDYRVDCVSASEAAYNSRVASYGDLTEVPQSCINSSRETDIPSEQIPALKDEILNMVNDYNTKATMLDLNKDGIEDCFVTIEFRNEEWRNILFSSDLLEPDKCFVSCSIVLLSDNDHVDVLYFTPDDCTQYINNMLSD